MQAQPRNALAIGLLLIIASLGFTTGKFPPSPAAHADSQRIVSLYVDGQKRTITTDASSVAKLLAKSGVKLSSGDLVDPAPATALPTGFFNVNVYRARPITVHDGEKIYQFASAFQSAHLLAQKAGLTLFPEDTYDMKVATDFVDPTQIGVEVIVHRALPVVVKVDGKTSLIRTQAKTVGSAIAGAGIKLGLKDTLSVPSAAPVTPNVAISITRVSDVTATLTEALPFATKTVLDPTVLKGQTTVQTAGSTGSRSAVWQIHYMNGVETGRVMEQLISQTDPVTQVVVVGTKVMYAGSVEYWRPQVVAAAAQWNLDPNRLMRIMSCESGGNATSISHFIVDGQHPEGLFQFLPTTWISSGGNMDNILDGSVQIQLAAKKMATQGFSAWQCQ